MVKEIIASDGKPIEVTDIPYGLTEKAGIKNGIMKPTMKRDMERAGKTVDVLCWRVTYDEDGYAVKCRKIN